MFKLKKGMKVKVSNGKTYIFYSYYMTYDCKEAFVEKEFGDIIILLEHIDWEETAKLNGIDLDKQKYIESLIERGDSEEQIKNKVNEVFGEEKNFSPKYDSDKLDWSLLPISEVEEIVKVLDYGKRKYEKNGWKNVEDAKTIYLSATYRHLVEHTKGNKIDEESGLSHLSHLAANVIFLMWFENNEEE